LDEHQANEIKATAELLGEDVSAFMTAAAMEVVRRKAREREVFADIDAEISRLESGASGTASPPTADSAIDEQWDHFFRNDAEGVA
jgi:adenosylcobinamide amidohydrolase